MNKNLILATVIFGFLGYWAFIRKDAMDRELKFQSKTYKLSKTYDGGGVKNFFYTEVGKDLNRSLEFLQLLTFQDEYPDTLRKSSFQNIANTYGLKESGQEGEFFGTAQRNSVNTASFAAIVKIKGKSQYLIYVKVKDAPTDPQTLNNEAPELLGAIKAVEKQLN